MDKMINENIFREYDIRGIVGQDLTREKVTILARAIGNFFVGNSAQKFESRKKIVVGFDARESSPVFHDVLIKELNDCGCDVLDIGRVPTPVLYFTLFTERADGGVMITGSHNPSNHNGFKICLGKNAIYGKQIQEIKKIALAEALNPIVRPTEKSVSKLIKYKEGKGIYSFETKEPEVKTVNLLDEYQKQLLRRISLVESNLKVVVDAGNGMGGVTAVPLYRRLGVEVIELFCEPDSNFPNHEPDPSQENNLQNLIRAVLENKADLGIAFDGDADRITVIDETGRIIWGDELMILLSREALREHPGATIIAEVKCTQMLFDEIETGGGTAIMSKAGHSIIKAKMRETGAILGGEMSGHIFFADRFYGFDDGCYAGARVLEILSKTGKTLSELFAEFPKTFSTPEIRISCAEEKKSFVIEKLIEEFSANHEVMTIDGARIKFENGWGLVRPSNTQALLILRFEADTKENLNILKNLIEEKVNNLVNKC